MNYWLFQMNPERYDLRGWLRDPMFNGYGRLLFFSMTQLAYAVEYGDGALVILGGSGQPGLYGVGRLVSGPLYIPDHPDVGGKYWRDPDEGNKPEDRVVIRLLCFSADGPLLSRDVLKNLPLPQVVRRRGAYSVEPKAWEAVLQLLGPDCSSRFA